jgi:hypothetical protein
MVIFRDEGSIASVIGGGGIPFPNVLESVSNVTSLLIHIELMVRTTFSLFFHLSPQNDSNFLPFF